MSQNDSFRLIPYDLCDKVVAYGAFVIAGLGYIWGGY